MEFNSDFKFDLTIGQIYEEKFAELLGKKIEVKRDFQYKETGNIFIEYECRGKRSGISTTQAEYWCYWLSEEHCIFINTNKLKNICRKYLGTKRDIQGGDNNLSKGILLPIDDLLKN